MLQHEIRDSASINHFSAKITLPAYAALEWPATCFVTNNSTPHKGTAAVAKGMAAH
jgi:hypothetical protein